MIVEFALCLSQDADQIPVGGGSCTPSSAMGQLLLDRLTAHAGLSLELVKEPATTGGSRRRGVVCLW